MLFELKTLATLEYISIKLFPQFFTALVLSQVIKFNWNVTQNTEVFFFFARNVYLDHLTSYDG